MNDFFSVAIIALSALTAFLGIRMFHSFLRYPPRHPERGMHLFNALFLFTLSLAVFWAGMNLTNRNISLEKEFAVYPIASYAPEKNSLLPSETWIYTTTEKRNVIARYYELRGAPMSTTTDGAHPGSLIILISRSPNLFLTIVEGGSETLLYYTKEGNITVTGGSTPPFSVP